MKTLLWFTLTLGINISFCQERFTINGTILDAQTRVPLSSASLQIPGYTELLADVDGAFSFTIPATLKNDSLVISYVGYKTVRKRIGNMKDREIILLHDYSVELRGVVVTSRKLNLKNIDSGLKQVKGALYAYETEVTNSMYNLFISHLEENDQTELLRQCSHELSRYSEEDRKFYEKYSSPFKKGSDTKTGAEVNFSEFPVVNISHGAATIFCKWLTEQYNISEGKKKFKKVLFRLPTLQEWQITALGYPKFQSWKLLENRVEVIIPSDTVSVILKGKKTMVPVGVDILYPWWMAYNYRRKPQNQLGCFMGNFGVKDYQFVCDKTRPGLDGWTKMAQTANYFPNQMGFYDVVGNVAEMTNEDGKACGGSWNDAPEQSTIHSVKNYSVADETVGFRIFMEVIEN